MEGAIEYSSMAERTEDFKMSSTPQIASLTSLPMGGTNIVSSASKFVSSGYGNGSVTPVSATSVSHRTISGITTRVPTTTISKVNSNRPASRINSVTSNATNLIGSISGAISTPASNLIGHINGNYTTTSASGDYTSSNAILGSSLIGTNVINRGGNYTSTSNYGGGHYTTIGNTTSTNLMGKLQGSSTTTNNIRQSSIINGGGNSSTVHGYRQGSALIGHVTSTIGGSTTTNSGHIGMNLIGSTTNLSTGSNLIGNVITSTGQTTTTNRVVTGQEVIIGTNQYVDESRIHVVGESVTEHEVRVPKKIVREEVIEKVIIVPERYLREEVVEEIIKVRQKIIQVAKPIVQETIVEVPEIEYIERIIEVPEIIQQEKIKEVAKIEYQERIIEVPVIVTQEKIVEIPEIEYVEIPYETIVEVPEVHEQVVVKQIFVPQRVEKPYPEYVNVEVSQDVMRSIPVPIESITTLQLRLPKIRPRYAKVDVPLYVPRFVEIAVPVEMMDEQMVANAEQYAQKVSFLAGQSAASLCELEKLGGALKNADISTFISAFRTTQEMTSFFESSWNSGKLPIDRLQNISTTHMTTTESSYINGSFNGMSGGTLVTSGSMGIGAGTGLIGTGSIGSGLIGMTTTSQSLVSGNIASEYISGGLISGTVSITGPTVATSGILTTASTLEAQNNVSATSCALTKLDSQKTEENLGKEAIEALPETTEEESRDEEE